MRLSEGVGFRVHIIDKASLAAKKYGPQSSKKYGEKAKNVYRRGESYCCSSQFSSCVLMHRHTSQYTQQTRLPSKSGSSSSRPQPVGVDLFFISPRFTDVKRTPCIYCLSCIVTVWSGWWWMSLISCLKMVKQASGSSWLQCFWPVLGRRYAELSSAPPVL